MKKMPKKCSTDQRFIWKRNTTYKIGTKCIIIVQVLICQSDKQCIGRVAKTILMKKMLKKCSTDQRFIRKKNTTYKIETLVNTFFASTKLFEEPLNSIQFLVWPKKFEPTPENFGTC